MPSYVTDCVKFVSTIGWIIVVQFHVENGGTVLFSKATTLNDLLLQLIFDTIPPLVVFPKLANADVPPELKTFTGFPDKLLAEYPL